MESVQIRPSSPAPVGRLEAAKPTFSVERVETVTTSESQRKSRLFKPKRRKHGRKVQNARKRFGEKTSRY